ncbi:hypothetical protein Tco_1417362 [Tanacetum coccineum]
MYMRIMPTKIELTLEQSQQGVSNDVLIDLLQVFPFKCGKLPVRYLGVPLLAKKLGQYWASVYLLPTIVIHDLEKLFKRFLWNAGDSAKGKARVSWKVVCKPKEQGGLGIKSLKNGMKNGKNVSMWYDKWCIDGPLSSVITRRDIYDARLDDNARVVDMIRDNQWVWPDGWRENFTILGNLSSTVNLVNKDDKVLWVTNAGDKVKFNTKQCDFPKNVWAKMVNLAFKMKMQVNLHDIVDSLAERKGKNNIGNVVGKLVLAATVYFIWHERNFRLFKGEKRSEEMIFNTICDSVRSKLMTIRVKKTLRTNNIAKKIGSPMEKPIPDCCLILLEPC